MDERAISIGSAASIWFEIWGGRRSGSKTFRYFQAKCKIIGFSQAISHIKIDAFQANFGKNRFFQTNFRKSSIFAGKFTKSFYFPDRNWPFTATPVQIIVFLFKSHHFRTYFLYMIRYNNISRPVQDPTTPKTPSPKSEGGHDPPNLQD